MPVVEGSPDRPGRRDRPVWTIGPRRCPNLHRVLTGICRHLTHDTGRMPYRPNGRSWQGSTNPLRNPKRASYASRLAAARAAKRKPKRGGPAAIIALGLVLIVTVVTVASATIIAAGGAIGMTIATLEQGLPDVRAFRDLGFAEPTTMLDRSGQGRARPSSGRSVARSSGTARIPPLILDVTTAVEDDTFWENPGFDLEATVNAFAQELGGGDRGGASTITQQLVRSRLLPTEVIDADDTADGLYTRKALEIIQAFKLTQAYPGEEGKKVDHHRLPQRDLLRSGGLRHRRGRGPVLRQGSRRPEHRGGRPPRRPPAATERVGPLPLRRQPEESAGRAGREGPARGSSSRPIPAAGRTHAASRRSSAPATRPGGSAREQTPRAARHRRRSSVAPSPCGACMRARAAGRR